MKTIFLIREEVKEDNSRKDNLASRIHFSKELHSTQSRAGSILTQNSPL